MNDWRYQIIGGLMLILKHELYSEQTSNPDS